MTDLLNNNDSENATFSFATHSDKESTVQNVNTQNMGAINNNNVYSVVSDQASPEKQHNTDLDKCQSVTEQSGTGDRKLSYTDSLDKKIIGSSEICMGSVEEVKYVLSTVESGDKCVQPNATLSGDKFVQPNATESGDNCVQPDSTESGDKCVQPNATERGDNCVQPDATEGGDKCVQPDATESGDNCVQPDATESGDKCVQPDATESGDKCVKPNATEGGDKCVQPDATEGGDKCVQPNATEGGDKCVQRDATESGDNCVQPDTTESGVKCVQPNATEGGDKCVQPDTTESGVKCVQPNATESGDKCVQPDATESDDKCVQPDATNHQCQQTEVSSRDAVIQVTEQKPDQSSELPKYILVKRKSQNMQDSSRKPGGKLTSLLQRLAAKINNATAPECSILNTSSIVSKTSPSEVETESAINQPYSTSVSDIRGEVTNTEQATSQSPVKQASSNPTENSSVSFIQIQHDAVSKNTKLTFKSSSQTNSPASKNSKKRTASSSIAHTVESTIFPDNIPIKIIKNGDSVPSGSHHKNNQPTKLSLLQNKPSGASLKTPGAQAVTISATVNDPKQCIVSTDVASFRSLGQRTPISTDKGKYVLGYVSLKDLPLNQSIGFNSPSTGSVVESDSEPSNVQTTTSKPKHQFSLLKHIKLPVSLNTSTGDVSKAPTIYSLLANSPTISVSSPKYSASGQTGVNVPATTSNLLSSMVMQELTNPSINSVIGSNRLVLSPHYNPGQIFFHPMPHAAVTNSNTKSLRSVTRTLSKVTTAATKKSKIKLINAPATSLLKNTPSRPPAVIVVPTAAAVTPLPTVLTISTIAYSKSDIPPGTAAISNISMKAVKTTPSSTANQIPSPPNQNLSDTHQSCSKLITKIAQRSLSHNSASKLSMDTKANLACPVDAAITTKLSQEISQSAQVAPPLLRIIVSTDSGCTIAENSVSLQSKDALKGKVATSDDSSYQMYTTDVLTMSKLLQALKTSQASAAPKDINSTVVPKTPQTSLISKTPQTSLISKTPQTSLISKTPHISLISKTPQTCVLTKTSVISKTSQSSAAHLAIDSINTCMTTPAHPKPVKVTASHPGNIPPIGRLPQTFQLVLPAMRNAVSLLNTSTTPTLVHNISALTKSSTNIASATETHAKRKPKSKTGKTTRNTILEKSIFKTNTTASPVLNTTSFKAMTVSAKTRAPRQPKENAVYSATLRTGQGPVSVMVVGPDIGDDSSDTLSDTGLSNLKCSVESQLKNEGSTSINCAEKLSELKYPELVEISSPAVQGTAKCTSDSLPDKVSEIGMLDLSCPEDFEASNQSSQKKLPSLDETGSDTLSDTEMPHVRYPKEAETSGHCIQQGSAVLDDEETDSDLDMDNTEEQDMSVLRQLLMNRVSAGLYDLASKPLQTEKNLTPDIEEDITNSQCSLELETAHKTHLTSCLEKPENKYSSKVGSIQQLLLAPPITKLQNSNPDQQPEDGNFYGLKIESIFSLNNNADCEEPEVYIDSNDQEIDAECPNDQSPVFNVRDSHDWKSFVNPCFVVLERLPKSEMLSRESSEIHSKCSKHCRKRTLDYLCNLSLLKCVNHSDVALTLKPKRGIAVKRSLGKTVKFKMWQKKMSANEEATVVESRTQNLQKLWPKNMCAIDETAIVESSAQNLPSLLHLKQEVSDLENKPTLDSSLVKPITENKAQNAVISQNSPCEMKKNISLEQIDKKTDDTKHPSSGITFTIPDIKSFLSGLERLKKQVGKKRAKMLKQKLTRKTKEKPQGKHKAKLINSELHTLPLTENLPVSSKIKNNAAVNRTIFSTASRCSVNTNTPSAGCDADHLPGASSISHQTTSQLNEEAAKVIPVKKSRASKKRVCKSGIPPAPASTTQHVAKVPIPKLRTGANVVNIQPKTQTLPAEKVKAALESLNSYLEATGRKPTEGNTQYILLKIDDQHILVKLPFNSASTVLLNNVTLSSLKTVPATSSTKMAPQRGVSGQFHQQINSGAHSKLAQDDSKTAATAVSSMSTVTTAVSSMSTVTTAVSSMSTVTTAVSSMSTVTTAVSSMSTVTTAVSSMSTVTTAVSNINNLTAAQNIAKVNSSFKILKTSNTDPLSIIRTSSTTLSLVPNIPKKAKTIKSILGIKKANEKTTSNSSKKSTSSSSLHQILGQSVPSLGQPLVNTSPQIGQSVFLSGTYSCVTSSLRTHPAVISLLRPTVSSQPQPIMSVVAHTPRMNNASSISTLPVPSSISSSSAASGCSTETSSGEPSTSLSSLPPNSLLLPERKRKSTVLSRELKRRKLEAKYPLPPGIVIKSELDDADYGLSTKWTDASEASDNGSFPVIYTQDSLFNELSEMSSDKQALSVSSSDKTESFLPLTTGQGLGTQNTRRKINDPEMSTLDTEDMLSTEPCENMEDSLDEPPALVDETTSGGVKERIRTKNVIDIQEDMPPILQPMFTSFCDLMEDTDIVEIDSTSFTHKKSISPHEAKQHIVARDSNKAEDSTSGTSLYSEASMDSGIDTSIPSNSSSYTSVKYFSSSVSEKPICKNLKIQHLKDLLKKKEMEIENMKKLRTEFPSLDLDNL